jgi:hypothetical protein
MSENKYTKRSGCAFKYGPVAEIADVSSFKNVNFGLGNAFLPFSFLRSSGVFFVETISYLEDAIFASQFQLGLPFSSCQLILPNACCFYRRKTNTSEVELKFLSESSLFLDLPLVLRGLLRESSLCLGRDCLFVDRFVILHLSYFFELGEEFGRFSVTP